MYHKELALLADRRQPSQIKPIQ